MQSPLQEELSNFLNRKISDLKGVGKFFSDKVATLVNGKTFFYLLLHKPIQVAEVKILPKLSEITNGELVTIKVRVEKHYPNEQNSDKKQPYKILCYNLSGYISLVFFRIFPSQINQLAVGNDVLITGVVNKKYNENQMVHPKKITIEKNANTNVNTNATTNATTNASVNGVDAKNITTYQNIDRQCLYPLTNTITNQFILNQIGFLLQKIKQYQYLLTQNKVSFEWHNQHILRKLSIPSFLEAIINLHQPRNNKEIENTGSNFNLAKRRLAFDELCAWQIGFLQAKHLLKNRKNNEEKSGLSMVNNPDIDIFIKLFDDNLPFNLTKQQKEICHLIAEELKTSKRILRLLQGDVGSGKTIVAIFATLIAVLQEKQVAIMVPTAVLANQHYQYFQKIINFLQDKIADKLPLFKQNLTSKSISLLTSNITNKKYLETTEQLINNKISIVIGTHAVLEDAVKFHNLGLVIIDEQHRFGVMQRVRLANKGADVSCLLLSATPIPRSLMMALYQDIDVSILSEKPQNRPKIKTSIISKAKVENLCHSLRNAIEKGEKIYWICPAITDNSDSENNKKTNNNKDLGELFYNEESQYSEMANVESRYLELQKYLSADLVAMIHGKIKEKDKQEIMKNFSDINSKARILVATTVIEVGIDVSDATIVIIENAENFGLAQLHQLRGRVGRGTKESYCILIHKNKIGLNSRKRLEILKNSNDGFYIAEEDLKMRGSGDIGGTKQSGFPEFKIANLSEDFDLLNYSGEVAKNIIAVDPNLTSEAYCNYRNLVNIFQQSQESTKIIAKIIDGG